MLINLRNALMAGKRLPYDAEVEYLESTGTQYINTLVNADSNLSVEITMANAGTPWLNVSPMGAILITPRARHHLNFDYVQPVNGINYYLGNGDNCVVASGYKPTDGEIFTFKVDAISKTFTLGSFLGTFPNDIFNTGLSYWLFGRNGTTPPYLGSLRIYSAKLWNGSTLVRDYIPVRKGTVGYLYDRVSGKLFGNAGSGDFVCGPDVVPVEWLESHGTQYIDTGYKLSSQNVVKCAAMCFNRNSVFGTYEDDKHFNLTGAGNNALFRFGTSNYQRGTTLNTIYDFECGRDMYINGTKVTSFTSDDFVCSYNCYLFARTQRATTPSDRLSGRIYWLKILSNSTHVRDFLPVRVGTEGAMMDVLTRRIYRNAGSGAFTYGNDLKYPIPAA